MPLNEDLLRFINQDMANPALDVFFSALVILGTIYVWLLFVPGLWWKDKKNEAVDLFFLIFLALAITTALKLLIAAPRPEDVRVVPLPVPSYFPYDSYSFPSNHASRAFASALFLSFRFKRWSGPLFVYAFLIGLAKIYVGAHYPVDVAAGAFVGMLLGLFFILLGRIESYITYRDKLIERVDRILHRVLEAVGRAAEEDSSCLREYRCAAV